MSNKITGRAASFTISGTSIPFTEITPKSNRELADSTDSLNYDSGSDLIWPEQLAVKGGLELSVKGWFNTSVTPSSVINLLASSAAAVPIVIKRNPTVTHGHGNFDISDYEEGIQIGETITYTMTLKSNGVYTYGS